MTVFVVPIEPLDNRYTKEWYEHIPNQLKGMLPSGTEIVVVDGMDISERGVTPGAFLDFQGTNIYKSSQLIAIAEVFDKVKDGDQFLFTDAWNPAILMVKYMADLLGRTITMHGIWHAGSYDETDILGFTIPDKRWSHSTELAIYHALSYNYFATNYHLQKFASVLGIEVERNQKLVLTGWPMEYLRKIITPCTSFSEERENIIIFPHRLSSDKQPDIFKDLAKERPNYQWVMCQEQNLTKPEYHALLKKAKILFSASTHENLGISVYEGFLSGAIPMVPDRLSYSEMFRTPKQHSPARPEHFQDMCLYPSAWTGSEYLNYKENLLYRIDILMNEYSSIVEDEKYWSDNSALHSYFSGDVLYGRMCLGCYTNIDE